MAEYHEPIIETTGHDDRQTLDDLTVLQDAGQEAPDGNGFVGAFLDRTDIGADVVEHNGVVHQGGGHAATLERAATTVYSQEEIDAALNWALQVADEAVVSYRRSQLDLVDVEERANDVITAPASDAVGAPADEVEVPHSAVRTVKSPTLIVTEIEPRDAGFVDAAADLIVEGAADVSVAADDDQSEEFSDVDTTADALAEVDADETTPDAASEFASPVNDSAVGDGSRLAPPVAENLRLKGTKKDDDLVGGAGNDVIKGRAGDDRLSGGGGRDKLVGGRGDDVLDGGAGRDRLSGGRGDDHLIGGAGSDRLVGGRGDDILNGGAGSDVMKGGRGDDLFIFGCDTVAGGAWSDRANGGAGEDTMDLSGIDGGWTLTTDDGEIYTSDMEGQGITDTSGFGGLVQLDDGSSIEFQNMELVNW